MKWEPRFVFPLLMSSVGLVMLVMAASYRLSSFECQISCYQGGYAFGHVSDQQPCTCFGLLERLPLASTLRNFTDDLAQMQSALNNQVFTVATPVDEYVACSQGPPGCGGSVVVSCTTTQLPPGCGSVVLPCTGSVQTPPGCGQAPPACSDYPPQCPFSLRYQVTVRVSQLAPESLQALLQAHSALSSLPRFLSGSGPPPSTAVALYRGLNLVCGLVFLCLGVGAGVAALCSSWLVSLLEPLKRRLRVAAWRLLVYSLAGAFLLGVMLALLLPLSHPESMLFCAFEGEFHWLLSAPFLPSGGVLGASCGPLQPYTTTWNNPALFLRLALVLLFTLILFVVYAKLAAFVPVDQGSSSIPWKMQWSVPIALLIVGVVLAGLSSQRLSAFECEVACLQSGYMFSHVNSSSPCSCQGVFVKLPLLQQLVSVRDSLVSLSASLSSSSVVDWPAGSVPCPDGGSYLPACPVDYSAGSLTVQPRQLVQAVAATVDDLLAALNSKFFFGQEPPLSSAVTAYRSLNIAAAVLLLCLACALFVASLALEPVKRLVLRILGIPLVLALLFYVPAAAFLASFVALVAAPLSPAEAALFCTLEGSLQFLFLPPHIAPGLPLGALCDQTTRSTTFNNPALFFRLLLIVLLGSLYAVLYFASVLAIRVLPVSSQQDDKTPWPEEKHEQEAASAAEKVTEL